MNRSTRRQAQQSARRRTKRDSDRKTAATPEYQRVARDPEKTRRGLLWIPPIVVALAAIPLLYLAIRFSLYATAYMRDIVLIGSSPSVGFTIGMYIYSAAGWLCLAGTLLALFITIRGSSARRRLWGSGIALVCAAIVPASWLLLGWV